MDGNEAIAIAGIVGAVVAALGGAWVGAHISWRIHRNELKHRERTRFHERRLACYAEYVRAAEALLVTLIRGDPLEEGAELARTLNREFGTLRFFASRPVSKAASYVHGLMQRAMGERDATARALLMPKLAGLVNDLITAGREELGVGSAALEASEALEVLEIAFPGSTKEMREHLKSP